MSDLSALLRRTHLDSHEEILKSANAALKKSKTDSTAQYARIIALLKLDCFDDTVRAFEEAGSSLASTARLEYAYALYKAGSLEKAETIAAQGGDGRGLKHVLAQVTYRLEKFDQSAAIYSELADGSPASVSEGNDLRINSAAVNAQLEWQGKGSKVKKKKPSREDLETFESTFNVACAAIARGELAQGQVLLRRAKDLCAASEELTDEEKKAEIGPILAQMVYVCARLERWEEASKIKDEIGDVDIGDEATNWITRVNDLVAESEEEGKKTFLKHRVFHSRPKLEKNERLFDFQAGLLNQDEDIINLFSAKYPGVKRSTTSYLSRQETPTTSALYNSISVLNAAAHAKDYTIKGALKVVLPLLEKRPSDVGLLLTVIQLYLLTNNHGSAITLLERFFSHLEESQSTKNTDVRFAPGLVGVLVSLYAKDGRKSHVKIELAKAAAYWRNRRKQDAEVNVSVPLLRAAGITLLESGDTEDAMQAGEIFKDLYDIDGKDRASTAGLIASYAITDPSQIPQSSLSSLAPAARLVLDIDALALEEAGVAKQSTLATTKESNKRSATELKRPKKKIRKSRMPKDFVQGKKMDEERWLPMRDRSYWRPKGKKGKKKAEGLTQGGVEDVKTPAEPMKIQSGGVGAKGKKKKGKSGKR